MLAPRFLASAFAAGPALLILLCLVLRRLARFDAGREADREARDHRHLRDGRQRVLRPDGGVHRLLQPDPGAHASHFEYLFPASTATRAGAVDVDVGGSGRGALVLLIVPRTRRTRTPARLRPAPRVPVALDRQGPGPDRRRVRAVAARRGGRLRADGRKCRSRPASGRSAPRWSPGSSRSPPACGTRRPADMPADVLFRASSSPASPATPARRWCRWRSCSRRRERGLAVRAFKKGPDYIDAAWLAWASGRPRATSTRS